MDTKVEVTTVPTRDLVCEQLARMRPGLVEQGVSSLGLFGSVARGEARENSDIDLAIEARDGFTLFDLVGVKLFVQEHMGREVDVVLLRGLSRRRQESALRDLIPIF